MVQPEHRGNACALLLWQQISLPRMLPRSITFRRRSPVPQSLLQQELQKKKPFTCPEQEATLNLMRTTDFISRESHALFDRHGLSAPQYNVLRILRGHRDTGLPCQKLVAQMVTQMPDITRLVDRLEASGLVRRERTEQDRRLVLVHITSAGMDLLARLDRPILDMHREQMSHLSRAELAELNRLLTKLRQPAAKAVVRGGGKAMHSKPTAHV